MTTATADIVALHARMSPGRQAANDLSSGQNWSYAEFDALIGTLAAALIARGVGPGDRVALLAGNSVALVALHFACGRVGAIFVPLNWRLTHIELAALLERAEPALFLADAGSAKPDGFPVAAFDVFLSAARDMSPHRHGVGDIDRPSLILFTSGTSGRPKGVIVTERNLRESAINFGQLTDVGRDSVFLCEAPMFHTLGLIANTRPVLHMGGSIVVGSGFEPGRTLARLSDPALGITHYCGVPQMMETLRKQPGFDPAPLHRLTALVTGGAPHSPADLKAWGDDGVTIVSGFGMSETGTVFGMPPDPAAAQQKPLSVGVGTPWVEARIVDGENVPCPAGIAGELKLRGPNVTPGYWHDPAETAKSFDADGWFATGDIARADEDGYYWIVDRKKDMFISGGENVYPAEIEAAVAGFPGLDECALVGLPDPRWGEAGHLAIVGHEIDEAALLTFLGDRIARYKLPKAIHRFAALPRTGTGKLQKAELRALLIARLG